MIGYIYVITNIINNKKYIGKTLICSVENRFKQHIRDSRKERYKNRPLYRAMNKYGLSNFTIETLDVCASDLLSNREQYWIQFYNTYKDGYNATLGGDGVKRINISDDDIINKYNELKKINKTAEHFHVCREIIETVLKNNSIKPIRYYNHIALEHMQKHTISTFDSIKDASQWLLDNQTKKKNCLFIPMDTNRVSFIF